MAHEAVSRRPPISLYMCVARDEGYAYAELGMCPSFKGRFLSRRAKP
jgi:hypothetical protein